MESSESHAIADWLSVFRHYVFVSTTGNLVWEVFQLPLYTVWERGTLAGC